MTALLAFLARSWPFIACLGIGLGTGGYLERNRWEARYNALQASTEQRLADAQAAANQALETQIHRRLDTEANNGKVIQQLQEERDGAVSARTVAERLLSAAQARRARGTPVPAGADRSGTFDSAQSAGDQRPSIPLGTLTAAIDECRDSIQRLAALQQEVSGQLSR